MMIGIYKIVITLLGNLPCQRFIAHAIGAVACLFSIREGQIAQLQMQWILRDKKVHLRHIYASIVRQLLELCNLNKHLKRVRGMQRSDLDLLMSQGRPIVGLTGHIGNWDLIAAYCHSIGTPVFAVGREARNKTIHQLLIWLRERAGIKVLWRSSRSQMEGAREIARALKSKAIVASLIDQDINSVSSDNALFFGHSCRTPCAIIDMGLIHNAIFVSAFCIRQPDGSFILTMKELKGDTIQGIIESFHRDLEAAIIAHPEQWMWIHKRWRTQEGFTTLSTQEYVTWLKKNISQLPSH